MEKKNSLFDGKGENDSSSQDKDLGYRKDGKKIERFIRIGKNEQAVPIAKGESKKEAAKQFIDSHENKSINKQKGKDGQIHKTELSKENIPKLDKNKPSPDNEAEELKRLARNNQNKELAKTIRNFDPISLKIGDKQIQVEFDKYTADKNIYAKGNSDRLGAKWKQEHFQDLPKILKNAKYWKSEQERGKDRPAHKGVSQWHYFRAKSGDKKGKYMILANVREKGNKYYLYEVAVTKQKLKKRALQK